MFGSKTSTRKVFSLFIISALVLSIFVGFIQLSYATSSTFTISKTGSTYVYTNNLGVNTTDSAYASTLINNAISAANARGGGTVNVLAGSYLLNVSIVPLSNVYVNCFSGVTIYQNTPASLSASISLVLTTSSISNFTWNGGTLNGNKGTLSDFRNTRTWSSNFFDYFGMSFYGGTDSGITIQNAVIENVIGQGIDLLYTTNGWCYNDTVINAGDNPITIDERSSNCTVEYCNVTHGQDVGINTFEATNCILRYNTVASIVNYTGASHWGIAAEGSNNIQIYNNIVSGCDYNIVSTSTNVIISNNVITGTANSEEGIQLQTVDNTLVQNNTISNCLAYQSIGTYGSGTGLELINNTITNSQGIYPTATDITIQGGSINSDDPNGDICLQGALDVQILNVTFSGLNGLMDYGEQSTNIYLAYNNFTALTGEKVSLPNCVNVTYADNIGISLCASVPSSATVDVGQLVTYSASVSGGTSPYTYQWYRNGVLVGTSATYLYTATTADLTAGTFTISVTVTDSVNNVVASSTETVTVDPVLVAPTVLASPNTVDQGQTSSLTTTVSTGASPYTYHWMEMAPGGSYVDVGTSSASFSFVTTGSTATGVWSFELQVTDSTGAMVTSSSVTVTVNAALTVSVSPTSWTMDVGQSKTFTATASGGSGTYTGYQWYMNGLLAQSGTASVIPFTPVSAGTYLITVTVTDSYVVTSALSSAASVTVSASPTVSIAPVGPLTMDVGQVQTFTVTASGGTGTLSYQWYLDGTAVGSNSASYSYTAVRTSHSVTCKVTDSASTPVTSPASNAVTVTVNQLTITVTQGANGAIARALAIIIAVVAIIILIFVAIAIKRKRRKPDNTLPKAETPVSNARLEYSK